MIEQVYRISFGVDAGWRVECWEFDPDARVCKLQLADEVSTWFMDDMTLAECDFAYTVDQAFQLFENKMSARICRLESRIADVREHVKQGAAAYYQYKKNKGETHGECETG